MIGIDQNMLARSKEVLNFFLVILLTVIEGLIRLLESVCHLLFSSIKLWTKRYVPSGLGFAIIGRFVAGFCSSRNMPNMHSSVMVFVSSGTALSLIGNWGGLGGITPGIE